MYSKKSVLFIVLLISAALFSTSVNAQSDLPIGIQKIIEYNKKSTEEFAIKISFFIAFIAGILGILSPCILPFLPAYFSYTFKEKKNVTKMTLVFFLGFSPVFVTLGAIAGFIGEQSLIRIQKDWLVSIAGIFIIILGLMSIFGKGFSSFIKTKHKFKNDVPGIFLFGIFFAVGWSACLGPILAGILGIGAILGNIFYSAILLFFYSLGNLLPLFILSVFYDKFNLSENKFIKGKVLTFSIVGKEYKIHSINLISGILFLVIGTVLLIYKGTAIINRFDIFGTKTYFYSLQNRLIAWEYANILGVIIFILFVMIIGMIVWRHKSKI